MRAAQLLSCLPLLVCAGVLQAAKPPGVPEETQGYTAYLVGGEPVATQPWMAALVYRDEAGSTRTRAQQQTCGGTLIAPEWILTAAHCVDRLHPYELQVLLGRTVLDEENLGQVHELADIVLHPDFDRVSLRSDIALLRLATPSTATPLLLADLSAREVLTGRRLDLYGWGQLFSPSAVDCKVEFSDGPANPAGFTCGVYTTRNSRERPDSLMHAQLTLHDFASCVQRYRDYAKSVGLNVPPDATPNGLKEDEPILCAWDDEEKATLCYGDSGGPLVGLINGRPYLVGISSFMQRGGCELSYQMSFFTEVAAYRDFIDEAQSRDLAWSFHTQCPGRPRASAQLTAPGVQGGSAEVRLNWDPVLNAESYVLHVVPIPIDAAGPREITLDAQATSYTAVLPAGSRFLVSVQAKARYCDGPLSQAVEVGAL